MIAQERLRRFLLVPRRNDMLAATNLTPLSQREGLGEGEMLLKQSGLVLCPSQANADLGLSNVG